VSKKFVLMVEGATEKAFLPAVRDYMAVRLGSEPKPRIETHVFDGRIPKGETLRRHVERLLTGKDAADAVIALTDVYTGIREFSDAADAKRKMRQWVGREPRFFPHVALHDFEAWLLSEAENTMIAVSPAPTFETSSTTNNRTIDHSHEYHLNP